MMHKFVLLVASSFVVVVVSIAQTPNAEFSALEIVCKGENIDIQNSSTGAVRYLWDFCDQDLETNPEVAEVITASSANVPTSIKIVYDSSSWYGFLSSRNNDKLFRLDFGNDLQNSPSIVDLGNVGGVFDGPKNIEFLKENGNWYALLINYGDNQLIRLNFDNGLTEPPSVMSLGNLGGWNVLRGLDLKTGNSEIYAIVSSSGDSKISILNFGESILNTPTLTTFSSILIDRPLGVELVHHENSWTGFVTSFNNQKIIKLDFGNNINSTPQFSEFANLATSPTELEMTREGESYHLFVITNEAFLTRIDFPDGLNNAATISPIGKQGVLDNTYALDIVYDAPYWYGFTVSFDSKKVTRLDYKELCNFASQQSTTTKSGDSVTFFQAGKHSIVLTAFDQFGNRDHVEQVISVTDDFSPVIDFQFDSQCLSSTNNIAAITDEPLISTTWMINSESRTGETITYDFPTPGTYEVTLEVESANGCGNRLTKEITIYEPPAPNFTPPTGQICTNGAVNFANTTDAKGADVDSVITYQWFVDDELVSKEANPAITFATGGDKTVRLEASIPGCTETTEQTLTVLQGPTVSFSVAQICQGDPITFENLTTGENITGYAWDFGDGGSFSSAISENPVYTFETAGTYTVSLSVANTLGCQNVYQQEIIVYEQPSVGFLSEVACVGTPTQFTDTTTAGYQRQRQSPGSGTSATAWVRRKYVTPPTPIRSRAPTTYNSLPKPQRAAPTRPRRRSLLRVRWRPGFPLLRSARPMRHPTPFCCPILRRWPKEIRLTAGSGR